MAQSLRTVTDRFSVIGNSRKYTQHNKRRYIVNAVRNALESPEVKERISLGECFGFYGHTNRALYHRETGSLDLPETCTVTIDGKPVVLNSVPSNRTVEISIDDDGIVTHTQEILDTEPGRIVDGMDRSQAGGWSWATSGNDQATASIVSNYHGMDYVTTPNYYSLNRNRAMLEGVTDVNAWRAASLKNAGYSPDAAASLLEHFERLDAYERDNSTVQRLMQNESELLLLQGMHQELMHKSEQQKAMLESANAVTERRRALLDVAQKKLPLFLTSAQKKALMNMESEEDLAIVSAIFESASASQVQSLPLGREKQYESAPSSTAKSTIGEFDAIIPKGFSLL